jgi:hypothetical protein
MNKICSKCKTQKPLSEFYKQKKGKDGYLSNCKTCQKTIMALYFAENKNKIKKVQMTYYATHKEDYRKRAKKWYLKNKNQIREVRKIYKRTQRKNNPIFKLKENFRRRIRQAILNQNSTKANKTYLLLGCSPYEYKNYLESKFQKGMSWENYGKWHIDHVRPCVSFDLSKEEEQYKCFHYSNTQPLWAADNLKKKDKI